MALHNLSITMVVLLVVLIIVIPLIIMEAMLPIVFEDVVGAGTTSTRSTI